MFKSFSIIKKNFRVNFCTKLDIYPDQIVENLRKNINDSVKLSDLEADIINNIHFFDSDQYVDIYTLLANNDKGTDRLWELLSRKVFDYELDSSQRLAMLRASQNTYRLDDIVLPHVMAPMIRKFANEDRRNDLTIYEQVLY